MKRKRQARDSSSSDLSAMAVPVHGAKAKQQPAAWQRTHPTPDDERDGSVKRTKSTGGPWKGYKNIDSSILKKGYKTELDQEAVDRDDATIEEGREAKCKV